MIRTKISENMKPLTKKILTVGAMVAVCSVACLAQDITASGALDKAESTIRGIGGQFLRVMKYIVGLVGAALLVWAFIKKAKGDQGGNDAIMNWGVTLIIVFFAFEVLSAIFNWKE